jgi:peptidoglycan/LPS O-acetylase OafA/YrhL
MGATGVGLFFALSGFLITSRLIAEQSRTGQISLKKFYLRRVFRLLPPTLVYLTMLAILTAMGTIAVTKQQWFSSLFFYRNYIPTAISTSGWYTAHFWSLNVEEHFYLLWPALLILTRRKLIVPITLALSIASWRFIDGHYHIVLTHLWFPGRTDVRLDSLLWGCILAIIMSAPALRQKLSKYFTGTVFLLLAAIDVVSNVVHGEHNYSPYEPLILGLIVLWPMLRPANAFSVLLEWEPLKWVGRLSYSLYIWQQLWLLFPGAPVTFGRFQHVPLNFLALFATGALSYYTVEKPMITLGHRLTKGSKITSVAKNTSIPVV